MILSMLILFMKIIINKLINNVVETFIVNLFNKNNKIGIKTIKNMILINFKFSINIVIQIKFSTI